MSYETLLKKLNYDKVSHNQWIGSIGEEQWMNLETKEIISLNKKTGFYYKFKEGYDCDCNDIQEPLEITLEEHKIIHQFLIDNNLLN